MRQKIVHIALPTQGRRTYPVAVAPGSFPRHAADLLRSLKGRGIFIVTDTTVRRLYGLPLLQLLAREGSHPVLLAFPAGERSKRLRTLGGVYSALLRAGIRRDSVLVALGGGVVGDLAGFAAATVLRGVPLVQIPTTLLAQVDSSVGGKVGIDHPPGKNLIGAFYQPEAVLIDPAVLRTLPARQFRSGLAEVVKIAAALDASFFALLERKSGEILRRRMQVLTPVIARAVALKAAVVAKDEREVGIRKALNVGHTLGHALEAASGYRLLHGDAVALGMAAEMEIAVGLGVLRPQDQARVLALMRALGLPVRFPRRIARGRFSAALTADKKGDHHGARFSLLGGIGCTLLDVRVDPGKLP